MADERRCYAGDLSSDAIGKTVVTPEPDTSGKVLQVSHFTGMSGHPVTEIVLDDANNLERVWENYPRVVLDETALVEVRS